MESARSGDCEVNQEGEAARLGEDVTRLGAIGVPEVERAEYPKPEHLTPACNTGAKLGLAPGGRKHGPKAGTLGWVGHRAP